MDSQELRQPRAAMLMATGLGLGHLPIASGTWGSLGGVALYLALDWGIPRLGNWVAGAPWGHGSPPFVSIYVVVSLVVALAGVWAAGIAAKQLNRRDPGIVVIDEVSGQLIAYFALAPLGWQELLAGFLLFRALDIWKPFPARQAESLHGGWGIMADDWIAGAYAALLLWSVRFLTGS
jgi:phosphatidylglycerophosphatase A